MLGQRKLLQRLGPGLIHAFIFWGFLVLGPTIVIAMIGVVSKHATFPWLGDQGWYAFLADLFAVLVLIGVASALWIRKVQRPRRFEGSHLGEADLILALIATIAITLLLWHATRIALGLNEWPASSAPASHLLSHLFGARRGHPRARAGLRVGSRHHDPRLSGLPAALQAPAHRVGGVQRLVRAHRSGRAPGAAALRRSRHRRGGHPLRGRDRRRPDVEADARHVLVHRVRAMPGRLPCVCHRQGALAKAADHGAARSGVLRRRRARHGTPPRCGRRRRRCGRRRCGRRRCGRRRWRGGARPDRPGAHRGPRGVGVGLRDLRGVRAGVPGIDRAR